MAEGYVLWNDTETYSEKPLEHGLFAYSEHVEIIVYAYAIDDGPIQVVEHPTVEFMQRIIDGARKIVFHNAAFDVRVLRAVGVKIDIAKVHCTMIRAMMHSLPGALASLCNILGVGREDAKQAQEGKKYIQMFCKPRPKKQKVRRYTKETHPEEWAGFLDYAGHDISAMRVVHDRLPWFNYTRDEVMLWRLDQQINGRGVCVDLDLANGAIRATAKAAEVLAARAAAVTRAPDGESSFVTSTTQRDRVLEFLRDHLGYEIEDLKKGTVERHIRELKAIIKAGEPTNLDLDRILALLELRLEAAATSPAKYKALINGVSADGRLRGTLQFAGAIRTGRWGGRVFQPQNLPRPKMKAADIEMGIEAIKQGIEDVLYDSPTELCKNAVRGCIIASPGKMLRVSDLSNIEGRMLAWLAGEEWKLQAFRDYDAGIGHDLYKVTAGGILGKDPGAVTEGERQVSGKVPELACGYQGSIGAFNTMGALYGVNLDDETVLAIVRAWRKKHPNVVNLWYGSERAAMAAVRNPGNVYKCGRLSFVKESSYLRMIKPSGLSLCYPNPLIKGGRVNCPDCLGRGFLYVEELDKAHELVPDPELGEEDGLTVACYLCEGTGVFDEGKEHLTYEGIDQYTRQWKVITTYGGKLVENATQSTSRDVFADGMRHADARGFEVVLHVHDELICETPDTPDFDVAHLSKIMATNPEWAAGLPLAAAGHNMRRYAKT